MAHGSDSDKLMDFWDDLQEECHNNTGDSLLVNINVNIWIASQLK